MKDLITITDSLYRVDNKRFEDLFSKERVKSIGGIAQYQNYYESSKDLYPTIHTIEVILRNRIDKVLCNHNPKSLSWIMDLLLYIIQNHPNAKKGSDTDKIKENIIKVVSKLDQANQYSSIKDFWTHCQNKSVIHSILISRLNFGFWILILKNEKLLYNIHNSSIDLAGAIFPILANKILKDPSLFFSFLHKKAEENCRSKLAKRPKSFYQYQKKQSFLFRF